MLALTVEGQFHEIFLEKTVPDKKVHHHRKTIQQFLTIQYI